MPTERSPNRFDFAPGESRAVLASFDGRRITADAGALLLGAADRVTGLTRCFASCFTDHRNPAFVEHSVQQELPRPQCQPWVIGSLKADRLLTQRSLG
ncbi:MAG TPA: transposase [Rhodopila sp.]|jgi:hypothetical protein